MRCGIVIRDNRDRRRACNVWARPVVDTIGWDGLRSQEAVREATATVLLLTWSVVWVDEVMWTPELKFRQDLRFGVLGYRP